MAESTQLALVKPCSICGAWYALSEYYEEPRSSTGFRSCCKVCHRAKVKARMADPDTHRRVSEYQAGYRERHRVEARARTARYRRDNPERVKLAQDEYRARPENQITARERARAFRIASPMRRREYEHRRRALVLSGTIGFISPDLLDAKFAYWGHRCWMCGTAEDLTIDHVKPLVKGGLHALANLRPACRSCNSSKNDRWPLAPGELKCCPSPSGANASYANSPRTSGEGRAPSAAS